MYGDPTFWTIAVPAASGLTGALGGAFLGAWLSRWNEQRKQRLDFAAQQMREFYSPMLGLKTHISSLSELRMRIEDTAQEVLALHPVPTPPSARPPELNESRKNGVAVHNGVIEYDNEQFRTELLPLYEEMLRVFSEKYWLADPDVQKQYARLVEYVELWKRILANAIPPEVVVAMRVEEKKLRPLYDALQVQFGRRQRMLDLQSQPA
jgi:hypothetical protein